MVGYDECTACWPMISSWNFYLLAVRKMFVLLDINAAEVRLIWSVKKQATVEKNLERILYYKLYHNIIVSLGVMIREHFR